MENISYLDLVVGSIVIILGIKGFLNGFLKEIFGFAGLIVGIYVASKLLGQIDFSFLESFLKIENKTIITLISFLIILSLIWLTSIAIGAVLSKLTKATGLGFVNSILGFIVGGGKYFIIFAVIITLLSNVKIFKSTMESFEKSSIFYPYLISTGEFMIQLDPKTFETNTTERNSTFYKIPYDKNIINKPKQGKI